MDETPEQREQIDRIIRDLLPPRFRGLAPIIPHHLDVSKPNLHDSKAEFLAEKEAVATAARNTLELGKFLSAQFSEDAPQRDLSERVGAFIDHRVKMKVSTNPPDSAGALIMQNIATVGLSYPVALALAHLHVALDARIEELSNQEAAFWNQKHRAPKHYARTIALRLAKLIVEVTGQRPTLGNEREGNHPSTDYGRALQEIYAVLGIKAGFKRPAQWAIDQLTDDDLLPRNKMGGILGAATNLGFPTKPDDPKARIAEALLKGRDQ